MILIGAESFVEIEVFLRSAYHCLVGLIEVLLGDHVSILPHCLHACLLADAGDVCSTDLVRPAHVLLQIDVFGKVHLGRDCLEDETLLTAVGQRELDFSVETAGTKESRIEGVSSVG